MAEACKNFKTVTKMVEVETLVASGVDLKLTPEEAVFVKAICGMFTAGKGAAKNTASAVYDALGGAGVDTSDRYYWDNVGNTQRPTMSEFTDPSDYV